MDLTTLLEAFGQRAGLGDCQLNGDNIFSILFDGNLNVNIEATGEEGSESGFLFHASAGPLPDPSPEILKQLLGANLFAFGEHDPIVAYDEHKNEIVLLRQYSLANMDLPTFEQAISEFANQLEYWKNYLLHGGETAQDDPETIDDESDVMTNPFDL